MLVAKEVAKHHFSDWSGGDWVLWCAVLALSAIFIAVSVGLWFAAYIGEGEDGPHFVHLSGAALFIGVVAFILFALGLWTIDRHLSEFRWVVVVGLPTALLTVGVSYGVRRVIVGDEAYYGARPGNEGRGLDNPWPIRVVAGLTVAIVLGAMLGDGLNRVASWVPTTVGLLVVVILCVLGAAAIEVSDNR